MMHGAGHANRPTAQQRYERSRLRAVGDVFVDHTTVIAVAPVRGYDPGNGGRVEIFLRGGGSVTVNGKADDIARLLDWGGLR